MGQGPINLTIVGLGGLGCPLIFFLLDEQRLPSNVQITIYDGESVELSNLNRQILFKESDVGRPKVDVVRELIAAGPFASRVSLIERNIKSPQEIARVVEDSSIVVDCTDDPGLKLQFNDYCVSLGRTYLYTGAVASTGVCFPVVPGSSCLRCAFEGIDESEESSRREACSTAGIWGPVTGMIALRAAELVFKSISGQPIPSELFRFEIAGLSTTTINIPPSPTCPLGCRHQTNSVTDLRPIPCPKNFVVAKIALEEAGNKPAAFLLKDEIQLERVTESLVSEGAKPLYPPHRLSDGSIRATYGLS